MEKNVTRGEDKSLYTNDVAGLGCLKKRRTTPADWGLGMTVGIAAITRKKDEEAIIFATDQMMSVGIRTADLPLVTKGFAVHKQWFTVWAGTVTFVTPILQKVAEALKTIPEPDLVTVSSTFVRVYQEERARLAEQYVLSPFRLDMQTFVGHLTSGQSASLADMQRRIQDFDFDCEFLVGGYGPDKKPHLFTVTPPGVEQHYDPIGFWCIGSGQDAASSSLMFRRIHAVMSAKEILYYVAEAKFMSEYSMGVGKGSLFMDVRPNEAGRMLQLEDVPKLRQLWEAEGQPPLPPNLDTRVPDFWTPEPKPPQPSESQT